MTPLPITSIPNAVKEAREEGKRTHDTPEIGENDEKMEGSTGPGDRSVVEAAEVEMGNVMQQHGHPHDGGGGGGGSPRTDSAVNSKGTNTHTPAWGGLPLVISIRGNK
jgi:hypothetical protein